MIARHFPPLVSGGARRSLLIAEGLQKLGVEVTVISPVEAKDYKSICVPHPQPEPRIDNMPMVETSRRVRLKNMMRMHILLPDPDIRWARRVVRVVKEQASGTYDGIITTSPPESVHVAGATLAKAFQTKWAADFRDTWLLDPLLDARKGRVRRFVEGRLARIWLKRADAIFAVSKTIAHELEGLLGKPVSVMPQMVRPSMPLSPLRNGVFNIGYTGSFSLSDPERTIDLLLNEVEAAYQQRQDFRIHIAGRLTIAESEAVLQSVASNVFKLHGLLEYEACLKFQAQMDALLLVTSAKTTATPGKKFEYEAFNLPILEISGGDNGGAAAFDGQLVLQACQDPDKFKTNKGPIFQVEAAAEMMCDALGIYQRPLLNR